MGRNPVLTRVPSRLRSDADSAAEPADRESDEEEWEDEELEDEEWEDEGWEDEGWEDADWDDEGWAGAEPADEGSWTTAEPADEAAAGETGSEGGATETRVQHSLDTLINTIPGEILVLWAALEGAAELYELPLWAYGLFLVVVAIATPVYVYRSIERPDDESTDTPDSTLKWWREANVRWQSVSATGAFLVWVYYLGGPFQAAGLQDAAVATVLVIVYPVLVVITPYYGSFILYQFSAPSSDGTRGEAVR